MVDHLDLCQKYFYERENMGNDKKNKKDKKNKELLSNVDTKKESASPKNAIDISINENNENDLAIKLSQLEKQIEKNNLQEKKHLKIEIIGIIIAVIGVLIPVFIYLDGKFTDVNVSIDECLTEKDIKSLTESVKEIELWVQGDINDSTKPGARSRLDKIEETLNIHPIDITTSAMLEGITYTTSMENVMAPPTSKIYTLTTYVGKDSEGNKYNISDIVNETVLLTYIEGGKEVYFLGQLNDNCHWDGYCVTNAYNSDGTLFGVCESNFDDGKRLDYESFYLSTIENEWIHTKKSCEDVGNLGTSEIIAFKNDKIKNFTTTNVKIYDFLYNEDFKKLDDKILLTYYHGYTSNNNYNDETGDAYLISFNSDKTIKTLYIGQFKNGAFHDQSGKAIEIVFDSSNDINKYFCYKGTFKNGNRTGAKPPYDYITQPEIDKIIADVNIDPNLLNWYKTE